MSLVQMSFSLWASHYKVESWAFSRCHLLKFEEIARGVFNEDSHRKSGIGCIEYIEYIRRLLPLP